jgi:hypothetical protein
VDLEDPLIMSTSTTSPLTDPFYDRYRISMPLGLRSENLCAAWDDFYSEYHPSGHTTLTDWQSRPAEGGMELYSAQIVIDSCRYNFTVPAFGPLSALTSMLFDAGIGIEILEFHQSQLGNNFATFMRCASDGYALWSIAMREGSDESAVEALIAAANRFQRDGRPEAVAA